MMQYFTRVKLVFALAGVAALLALAVILYFFNPETSGFYPRCWFFVLTGWQCAGCGGTRALYSVLHGDFSRALELNILPFLAGPFLLLLLLKPAWARKPIVGAGAVIAIIAYTLWRNI